MCYAVTCTTCGKTTWDGCGQHVSDVRRGVPASQWCEGHPSGAGFFGRVFGKA